VSATAADTAAQSHPDGADQRADLLDRLVELRKALHGGVQEIARLRRANAALRGDVARLEAELSAERARP
jgi:hypothetical protein